MSIQKRVFYLVLAILSIIYIPYIGTFIKFNGIPADYFSFPALAPRPKPAPQLVTTIINVAIFLGIMLLFLFPGLYGFKKNKNVDKISVKKVGLPIWFWIGLIMWTGTFFVLAGKFSEPKWLLNWALLPLCWGFTLFLDGLVYYRKGGDSLIGNAPTELIAMGILSISGWLIFEYLNFFINLNWYYPEAILVKSHDTFLLYAILGSSGWIPLAFEWYFFLMSFKRINVKYKFGPKVKFTNFTKLSLLVLSLIGLFSAPYNYDNLFYVIWLAPLIILSVTLSLLGIRTPFTSIKENGDWSPLIVFGLTFLIQGVIVEFWNAASVTHLPGGQIKCFNPAYWQYCIPYTLPYKIFEMPLFGYIGYVPFGVYCWIWWIFCSFLMNISSKASIKEDFR